MNSSSSWFTSYERSLLKSDYGTQRHRLTRDHSKPLDSCNLCLQRARDPVCCSTHGDIFCRECAISNLLSQRAEIKRLQKEIEKRHVEEEEDRVRLEREAVERGVKEFEEVQMGLERRRIGNNKPKELKRKAGDAVDNDNDDDSTPIQRIIGRENGKITVEETSRESKRSKTFTLDESELLRIARSDRDRLKSSITAEKSAAAAPKLPSFWIPSLTPSLATSEIAPRKPPKLQPVCPASDPERLHNYSLKSLVSLAFAEEEEEKNKHGEKARICPSCKKGLSNETKAVVAKPCGHVICKPCVKKFILHSDDPHAHFAGKEQRILCSVCETDLTEPTSSGSKSSKKKDKDKDKDAIKPGLVQISSDGTGFTAGGGKVLAKKEMVAFQC